MVKENMHGGDNPQPTTLFSTMFKSTSTPAKPQSDSWYSNISTKASTPILYTPKQSTSSGLTFQKIISYIAAIILAGTLTIIGFMIYRSKQSIKYPPEISECPDYWETIGPNKCKNNLKVGTCDVDEMDFNDPKYSGPQGKVEKCKWANGCGVVWDGLKC